MEKTLPEALLLLIIYLEEHPLLLPRGTRSVHVLAHNSHAIETWRNQTVQSADDVIMYSTWRGRCVVLLCLGAVWDLRERDHTPHTQHGTTSKEECTTLFLWCVVVLHTEIGDGPFPCYLHATMLQCYAWKVKAFLSICW